MGILDKLKMEFGIYKSDDAYYEKLISNYSSDLKKIREQILADIRNDWINYHNNWFISFANQASLDDIISVLKKFKLELNPIIVQNITQNCSNFDLYLKEKLSKKEKWQDEDFEKEFSSGVLHDLMYNYAIIKNALDLELDVITSSKEINYDSIIGNSTKMYIKEIRNLQDFEHNYERIIKYNEYKKLAKATDDPELKKKYEKEVLKYRNLIVESNLCLVLPIAKRYHNVDIDFLELVQEGSLGIIEALERFDPDKSFAFSTYAIWWIRQMITRYIYMNGRTIRIPINSHEKFGKIIRARDELKNELFRDPTDEEIAAKLGWPKSKVINILKSFELPVSLDAAIMNEDMEEDASLYSFIADEYDYDNNIFQTEFIDKYLNKADARQQFIIRMRYGLSDGKDPRFENPHTLEEVGKELGLTRERVRQIEKRFIGKVREKEHIHVGHYTNKKNCYFWELFDGFEREKVLEKFRYLSNEDLEKLYMKYGHDLNGFTNLDQTKNGSVFFIINKIKRMIKDPNYLPKYYNRKNGSNEIKPIFIYTGLTIYNITKKTAVKIKELMIDNSYSYELLTRVFGANLDEKATDSNIELNEIIYVNNIINSIINSISLNDNNRTLQEILECNDEEFLDIINFISSKPNYNFMIKRIFGDNYQNKSDLFLLSQKEYETWLSIIKSIKNRLNKIRKIKRYSGKTHLGSILGKNETELERIINSIKPNTKIYGIIQKYINEEPLSYTEKTLLYNWCGKVKKNENYGKRKNQKEIINLNYILKSLHLKEEEFIVLYNNMDSNTTIYVLLTKIMNNEVLNDKEASLVRTWLYLKVSNEKNKEIFTLPDNDNKRALLQYLQITELELINTLSNVHHGSLRHKAIMKYLNEEELDSKEKGAFFNWRTAIKKVYSNSQEVLLKENHVGIKAPASVLKLKDIIDAMPQTISRIMSLRFGLFDGTIYSIEEIAEMYNMSPEEVEECIEEGTNIIKNSAIDIDIVKLIKKI